jgi:hypothetical protein
MAGTIVVDRLESDASYASSINVASPMVISNTITMGSSAAISGNVNFDSGTLFVDSVNNRVGVGTQNPATSMALDVRGNMRLGDGVSGEQDITYVTSGSGTGWQVGVNDGSLASTNQYYVYNNTAAAYYLQIDSAGRVTQPKQPRFFASNRNTDSSASNLVFTTVGENVGSHYSNSTGRFTAPVAGTYVFKWGSLFGTNNTVGRFYLRRNGSDVGGNSDINQLRLDCGASGSEILQGERTFLISAAAGDYFNIYFASDDGSSNSTSTTYAFFTGWLLA